MQLIKTILKDSTLYYSFISRENYNVYYEEKDKRRKGRETEGAIAHRKSNLPGEEAMNTN